MKRRLQLGAGSGERSRCNSRLPVVALALLFCSTAPSYGLNIQLSGQSYLFSTLAGANGLPYGHVDANGLDARFTGPAGVAIDGDGFLYVIDNFYIRKISPDGDVTTLAGGTQGSADGVGVAAKFNVPQRLAVDKQGNVFVTDTNNSTIRKITPAGEVTTFVGLAGSDGFVNGTGSEARLRYPCGIAIDTSGNLFVVDRGNAAIRKITPEGGVTTIVGGPSSPSLFMSVTDIALRPNGEMLVTNKDSRQILKVDLAGNVTVFAGTGLAGGLDGPAMSAQFQDLEGIAIDATGNAYVADYSLNTIRKITPAGDVSTVAGPGRRVWSGSGFSTSSDGQGIEAELYGPRGLAVDTQGNVYIADQNNALVRRLSASGYVSTVAGFPGSAGYSDGDSKAARFSGPSGICVDDSGNVYVSETWNGTIRKIDPNGNVTTLVGRAGSYGYVDAHGVDARFVKPADIDVDSSGNLFVVDYGAGTIRKITPSGDVTTFAGVPGEYDIIDGPLASARFGSPWGIAISESGDIFVSEVGGPVIRKISSSGVVSTIAGSIGSKGAANGHVGSAQFSEPEGLAVDLLGNIYVADWPTTVRLIGTSGDVSTLAGVQGQNDYVDAYGADARLSWVNDVAVDGMGNVFVTETQNNAVRRIEPSGAVTTTLIRSDQYGSGDPNDTIRLTSPAGVCTDRHGNIYIANYGANTIVKGTLQPSGYVPPFFARQPESVAAQVGTPIVLTAIVRGLPTPECQWFKDGIPIEGSTAPVLNVGAATFGDAGTYTYVASSIAGSATSMGAVVTVGAPQFSSEPLSYNIATGGTVAFDTEAFGTPVPLLQWQVSMDGGVTWNDLTDGGPYSGSNTATLMVRQATVAMNGLHFRVVATNSQGTATSDEGVLNVAATVSSRLINLSTRAFAGSGNGTLIMGFYIAGTGTKTVLIRCVGPAMALPPYNVPSVVTDPSLTVYSGSTAIAQNNDWDSALATDFANVGAFALDPGSKDAALIATLKPGAYTVHLVNPGPVAEGLIEIYDLSRDLDTRLVNLSCRLKISPGQTVIVGTYLLGGPQSILVRNAGPALSLNLPQDFAESDVLPDPRLAVFNGQALIDEDDDWDSALAARFAAAGAFGFATGSKDAAIRPTLTQGGYTVHAAGAGGEGIALIELYESP